MTSPKPAAGFLAAGIAVGAVAALFRALAAHFATTGYQGEGEATALYTLAFIVALVSTACFTVGVYRLVKHADDAAEQAAYRSGEGARKAAEFREYLGTADDDSLRKG